MYLVDTLGRTDMASVLLLWSQPPTDCVPYTTPVGQRSLVPCTMGFWTGLFGDSMHTRDSCCSLVLFSVGLPSTFPSGTISTAGFCTARTGTILQAGMCVADCVYSASRRAPELSGLVCAARVAALKDCWKGLTWDANKCAPTNCHQLPLIN